MRTHRARSLTRDAIPAIVCFDVEPTKRVPSTAADSDWSGFERLAAHSSRWRDSLTAATGRPAQISWFLRVDEQIDRLYGDPSWVAVAYKAELRGLEDAGDEVGIHIHPWRWDYESGGWYANFSDHHWSESLVRSSLAAFEAALGRPCRSTRFGDRWLDPRLLRIAARLGVRFDLSPEPGMVDEPLPEPRVGDRPDYSETPHTAHSLRRQRVAPLPRRSHNRSPAILPVTTIDRDRACELLIARAVKEVTDRPVGSTRGHLDHIDADYISGWAQSPSAPTRRLPVVVSADSLPVAAGWADAFRHDLAAAGIGDGRHGFTVPMPYSLRDGNRHLIEVRVPGTDTDLSGSGVTHQWSTDDGRQPMVALDLGHIWMPDMLTAVLEEVETRSHLCMVARSAVDPEVAGRTLDRIATHEASDRVWVTTPGNAVRLLTGT